MKTLFLLLIALTSLSFSSTAEETTLSAAQHSYIQNKQKLVIAKPMYLFNQVWEDFVVNRNQDTCDSVQGMLRDYLNIEVEVKEYFSSRALLSAIASGEADLTIGFAETRRRAEQFEFSDSLYDIQNVYWYRDDVAKNTPHDQLKWVCIKSSLFCQLLNQQGVSDPMVVNSTSELLPAIANGFADATILDLTSVQSYYSVMTSGEWQGALSFNRLLFAKQLKRFDLKTVIVKDGQEAMEELENSETPVDIIITDCHMPNMDGYQLTEKIRSLDKLKHLPIIGCTAEDSKLVIEKAERVGMDQVIYKPYSFEELDLAIASAQAVINRLDSL